MKIYGKSIRLSQLFFLTIYYGFAQYLPNSYCAFRPLGMASSGRRRSVSGNPSSLPVSSWLIVFVAVRREKKSEMALRQFIIDADSVFLGKTIRESGIQIGRASCRERVYRLV